MKTIKIVYLRAEHYKALWYTIFYLISCIFACCFIYPYKIVSLIGITQLLYKLKFIVSFNFSKNGETVRKIENILF